MRQDSRLCVALHVLMHMHETDQPLTSEALGSMMQQNSAVLRRTMAGLRNAGLVRAEKGHGGGWSLVRPLDTVTLGDVYAALGLAAPFRLGVREARPTCRFERSANRAVDKALAEAEALLVERLGMITVSEIVNDV